MENLSADKNSLDILTLYLNGDVDEASALLSSNEDTAHADIEMVVKKVFDPLIKTPQYPKLRLVK